MRIIQIFFLLFLIGCNRGFRLIESNDFFATFLKVGGADDHNFTQGLALSYESDSNFSKEIASHIPVLPINQAAQPPTRVSYKIGQDIYTPEDLTSKEPIPDDNPYAGWLYGKVERVDEYPDQKLSTAVYVGVIGPWSRAAEIQKWFHELCDCQDPKGWDNQLHNELGLYVDHSREWEHFRLDCSGFELTSIGGLTARLGNVHTDLTHFTEIRFGRNVPMYNEPEEHKKWRTYARGRLGATAVTRNIFFDGNTFGDSQHVHKEAGVVHGDIGLVAEYRGWGINLHYVIRSKEFEEEKADTHTFMIIDLVKDF